MWFWEEVTLWQGWGEAEEAQSPWFLQHRVGLRQQVGQWQVSALSAGWTVTGERSFSRLDSDRWVLFQVLMLASALEWRKVDACVAVCQACSIWAVAAHVRLSPSSWWNGVPHFPRKGVLQLLGEEELNVMGGGGVHFPLESKDWWGYISPQKARIGGVTFPSGKQGLVGLHFPLESKDWWGYISPRKARIGGVTFPLGKQGLVGLHFPLESKDWWGYISPRKARIGGVTFPLGKQGLVGLHFPSESKDW